MEDPVPQFVAYGESIEYTKHLMKASKGTKVLIFQMEEGGGVRDITVK